MKHGGVSVCESYHELSSHYSIFRGFHVFSPSLWRAEDIKIHVLEFGGAHWYSTAVFELLVSKYVRLNKFNSCPARPKKNFTKSHSIFATFTPLPKIYTTTKPYETNMPRHEHEYNNMYWDDMPEAAHKAAAILGYTKESWDADSPVPYDSKSFFDCTNAEKQAAMFLNLNPIAKKLNVWWEDLDQATKDQALALGWTQEKWDDDWVRGSCGICRVNANQPQVCEVGEFAAVGLLLVLTVEFYYVFLERRKLNICPLISCTGPISTPSSKRRPSTLDTPRQRGMKLGRKPTLLHRAVANRRLLRQSLPLRLRPRRRPTSPTKRRIRLLRHPRVKSLRLCPRRKMTRTKRRKMTTTSLSSRSKSCLESSGTNCKQSASPKAKLER
jgi:hypothetical protein